MTRMLFLTMFAGACGAEVPASSEQAEELVQTPMVITLRSEVDRQSPGGIFLSARFVVKNEDYDKRVTLVYSSDEWRTVRTEDARYVADAGGGYELWGVRTRLFDHVPFGADLPRVDYAVSYSVRGRTYWDNNGGANYDIRRKQPTPACEISWMSAAVDLSLGVQFKVRNLSYAKRIAGDFRIDAHPVNRLVAHFVRTLPDGRELWEGSGQFAQGPTSPAPFFSLYPSCTVVGVNFDAPHLQGFTRAVSAPFPGSLGERE